MKRVLRALPATPRCGYCGAPFAGIGGVLMKPLGYRPSRKNPNVCAVCVELTPPGGMTAEAGVLFADVRGFTGMSERAGPEKATALLRRFYRYAEDVLFPEALIDKLIGDEVMALYLPVFIQRHHDAVDDEDRSRLASLMVDHARELLERAGYGTSDGPSFEIGIGIDYGEVFIGNIGDSAVHDFTAVGDVVNTASRLQHEAAAGEVIISGRLARFLDVPPGAVEEFVLKGKQEPVTAYRVSSVTATR